MDRFVWTVWSLLPGEAAVLQQGGVRVYDGDQRTPFNDGVLTLTNHRLIYRDATDQQSTIALSLHLIVLLGEEGSGIAKSAKIVAHLSAREPGRGPGPSNSDRFQYVRFSFRQGGAKEFHESLAETLRRKTWSKSGTEVVRPKLQGGAGIVGIERKLEEKRKKTDASINTAFEDLSKLMAKAKEMVELSKSIAAKIKNKQGGISDDETVRFKSYLLSMGIASPVTQKTHGTGIIYHNELARELSKTLLGHIEDSGGVMALNDVYCLVNRARGMELLSPDDLVNACRQLQGLDLPMALRTFDSGVMVLQLRGHNETRMMEEAAEITAQKKSVTAEELARVIGISVVLAKERLLLAEKAGRLCRDESIEGLRFYPNLFLTKTA